MKLNRTMRSLIRKASRQFDPVKAVKTAASLQRQMQKTLKALAPVVKTSKPARLSKPAGSKSSRRASPVHSEARTDPGQFLSCLHADLAGSRSYKLYIPASYQGQARPLVVMLHGCGQNPDDFAAGTRMNALAERKNFLVAYPAQASAASRQRCWNWFRALNQARGRGEPAIIAGITRDIMARYEVDPKRVYVAGLSAGGAMAAILAETYPDLYAAVGIHSGLPYAWAHDLTSAITAMKSGIGSGRRSSRKSGMPVIVFHGDQDATVHPRNGEQALAQHLPHAARHAGRHASERHEKTRKHSYTRTVHHDLDGKAMAEHWLVHGSGHAWSGGSARGSYTDSKGPDASREMLRFFWQHRLKADLAEPDPA